MHLSFIALAAAAAAQTAAPHSGVKWQPLQQEQAPHGTNDAEQARASGYAQAQQALTGNGVAQQTPTDLPVQPVATTAGTAPQPLALSCTGAGTADKQRGTFLAGGWGWASAVSHHDRQFADQVDIRLFSGDDRIRIPRTMLPGIHGGQDGWFKLKDVIADARAIHASAAVAAFHNPKVYIDRMTGTISISGKSGDYSGQCQAMDASAAAKF